MKIRKLNSLRGLAALIVLVSHYSNESGLWGGALGSGAGQFGVMLFFLLSSFLVAYLYLEKPPTPCAIKSYAIARIARVIPLFIAVVIACFTAQLSGPSIFSDIAFNINSTNSLLSHLFFLYGENVLWTIPPEIQFYILFLCAWLLRPHFRNGIFLLSLLVLIAYSFRMWPQTHTTTIFGLSVTLNILTALPYFTLGGLLGYTFRYWQPPAWLCSHWFVTALLLVPLLYPMIFFELTGYSHDMWLDPAIFICISIIFFAVVFLVPPNNPLLENRIGDMVGEISYSLYLLHYPLLLALKKMNLTSGVLGLLLFLFLSFVLAAISFKLFEAPMRQKIRALYQPNRVSNGF